MKLRTPQLNSPYPKLHTREIPEWDRFNIVAGRTCMWFASAAIVAAVVWWVS